MSEEPENFIIPLVNIVEIILNSSSLKEMYDNINKYKKPDNNCKYVIPELDENIVKFTKSILSKGYKNTWCLLIEYVVNNIQLLSNVKTIPKNQKYKNENIGLVFSNLCKDLPDNSPYKPFKYDFIELITILNLQFNGLNSDDLISSTPCRHK